jgi:dUTP pyrophosphatase
MKIKLTSPTAKAPTRAHPSDAGLDCYADETAVIEPMDTKRIKLGFAIELPDGIELQVRGRSGNSSRGLICHLGTVDSGYRGEVSAILTNLAPTTAIIMRGDRIAQAVIARYISALPAIVDQLSDSDRGAKGFGSTGT